MNDSSEVEKTPVQEDVSTTHERRWRPLSPVERRVLGVLVEKAKTVPSAYPMTLNAIVTGCNQKNNRDPVMELTEEVVEQALENLRQMGAVGLVQGMGRVDKYRHYLYEWLGVEKEELSIIAELLLRGPQTEGELRAHVSRMDPIPDLPTLRRHLDSLTQKGLIVHLTPPGRGHTVAHNLYPEAELARLRQRFAAVPVKESGDMDGNPAGAPVAQKDVGSTGLLGSSTTEELEKLRHEIEELKQTVATLLADVTRIKQELGL